MPKTTSKSPSKPQTPQPTTRLEPAQKPVIDEPSTLNEVYQPGPPNGSAKPATPSRKLAYPLPQHVSATTISNTQSLLRFVILGLISAAAIGSRLFAVIRFESVIHEL